MSQKRAKTGSFLFGSTGSCAHRPGEMTLRVAISLRGGLGAEKFPGTGGRGGPEGSKTVDSSGTRK